MYGVLVGVPTDGWELFRVNVIQIIHSDFKIGVLTVGGSTIRTICSVLGRQSSEFAIPG